MSKCDAGDLRYLQIILAIFDWRILGQHLKHVNETISAQRFALARANAGISVYA